MKLLGVNFFVGALLIFASFQSFAVPSKGISKIEGLDIISQTDKTVDLTSLKPDIKATVLVFLSPLCPCSNHHTATLKNLIKDNKDFKFVAMYSSDDTDEYPEYFKSLDLGIPVIKDNHYKYANELKASNTPDAFVINGKGEVLYRGGVTSSSKASADSEQYLKNALNQIREKKEVKPSETRVLGCAIRDT